MRKNYIFITVDYETWQPLPEGYEIDWEKDLLENAQKLMDCCESSGARITFMVEMCELFWLYENNPSIAQKVEAQIEQMVLRGHDVQLHMHPNWMPETGACRQEGEWCWNWEMASGEQYPYDYTALMKRCKDKLEAIVRRVKPDYKAVAYRAGAYRIQPFFRTATAMKKNGLYCDTSVYRGGKSKERNVDFSRCKSSNRPYFASDQDPQIVENEKTELVEIPILTYAYDRRWFLDNDEAARFGGRFLQLGPDYFSDQENYFVMIGHSKGVHDYAAIEKQLTILKNYPGNIFAVIGEKAADIRRELLRKEDRRKAARSIEEVGQIMECLYGCIEPGSCENDDKPEGVLGGARALCCGYAVTLYKVLKQYGYKVRWLTMYARDMPKGRGRQKIDTHEVVSLKLGKRAYVLDPMANTIIPHGIRRLLKNPDLAIKKKSPDRRYVDRGYEQYDTAFFYRRAVFYIRRGIYEYKMADETIRQTIKRQLYNLVYHILPGKCKVYNRFSLGKSGKDLRL